MLMADVPDRPSVSGMNWLLATASDVLISSSFFRPDAVGFGRVDVAGWIFPDEGCLSVAGLVSRVSTGGCVFSAAGGGTVAGAADGTCETANDSCDLC